MLNIAKFFLPWFSPTWTSKSLLVQVISSCWSYHRTILFHFICAVLWPCFSLAHLVVLHGFVTIRCDSKCSVNQSVLERQWKSNKGHEDTMKISMSFHGKKFQSLKVICRVLKNYFFVFIANHFLAHEEIPGSKYIVGVKWGLECWRNLIRFILLGSLGPKLASERSVAAPSQADFLRTLTGNKIWTGKRGGGWRGWGGQPWDSWHLPLGLSLVDVCPWVMPSW